MTIHGNLPCLLEMMSLKSQGCCCLEKFSVAAPGGLLLPESTVFAELRSSSPSPLVNCYSSGSPVEIRARHLRSFPLVKQGRILVALTALSQLVNVFLPDGVKVVVNCDHS
jgi:hypothetical protein